MDSPYIIGIAGGSASGKTYFLKKLISNIGTGKVCMISQDNYYFPKEIQPKDVQGVENFDVPESIDVAAFEEDLKNLIDGNEVEKWEYNFNNPLLPQKKIFIKPAKVIIAEGIFVLYLPEIVKHLNLKVFFDVKEHIKLSRRIIRDKEERGYSLEDVLYRYQYHVVPAYEKYIEPSKYNADIIVPNNHNFQNALEILTCFIKSKLDDGSHDQHFIA